MHELRHLLTMVLLLVGVSDWINVLPPLQAEEGAPLAVDPGTLIPSVIYGSEGGEFPLWVAADIALDSNGAPDPAYFRAHDALVIRNFFEIEPNPQTGCIDLDTFYVDYAGEPDRQNLAGAIESSELVVVGRVLAARSGFAWETPGTLYAIERETLLKGRSEREIFYVPYPRGEMEIGPYRLCKTDTDYAESPEVGDSVLVMLHLYPDPQEAFLRPRFDTSLVTLRADKTVGLPSARFREEASHLKASGGPPRDELIGRIQEIIAAEVP